MNSLFRAAVVLPLWAAMCFPASAAGQAKPVPSIRSVQVLRSRGQVEIEVEASDRIVPQVNLLRGPDRLVVDFVNATPGAQLRGQAVNRAEVKSLRVGLFSANPPVTRIVLDLNGPQAYQVFPSGRTVIVKVGDSGGETAGFRSNGPTLMNSNYSANGAHLSVASPPPPRLPLQVSFKDGLLYISATKANLTEVLFEVHQRTGAEIAIPAGAEQEQVVGELGPAPAPEVLSQLLNGTKFNFLILNSARDPRILDSVILSSRPEGPMPRPAPQARVVAQDDDEAEAAEVRTRSGAPAPPAAPAVERAKPATGQAAPAQDNSKPAGDTDNPE